MKQKRNPNLSASQFSRTVAHENGLVRVEKDFRHATEGDMQVVRNAYQGLYPNQPNPDEDYATD